MEVSQRSSVKISENKVITKPDLLSLLKTYNCYHEGKSFQLRSREEDGELIIEGLLSISWGLMRPIRLQMQDDGERFRQHSVVPSRQEKILNITQKWPSLEANSNTNVSEEMNTPTHTGQSATYSQETGSDTTDHEDETPQLMRTRSDASFMGVQRRSTLHSHGEALRMRKHRFSINGHFYNHKTSVFTPAYGSVTSVRVNSTMTSSQVLHLLLNKFRVENKSEDFILYMVHESGEKTKLKDTEYPLLSRLLYGPCEKIAKVFLMEADLGEEVTYDVAQYIKFELPVLDSFVEKLKEEEEREILKLTKKYSALKYRVLQQLEHAAPSAGY